MYAAPLPPAPPVAALVTPEDMKLARAWIAAFERVNTDDIPRSQSMDRLPTLVAMALTNARSMLPLLCQLLSRLAILVLLVQGPFLSLALALFLYPR